MERVVPTMVSFSFLALIAAVALVAPLAIALSGLRLPAIVLEILLGIAIGPQGLGWATADSAVKVLSTIGLSFLLFLAGLEIDFDRPRVRRRARDQPTPGGFGFYIST